MNRFILLLFVIVFLSQSAFADCFIVKEKSKIIKSEGDCSTRHSPCSTFKIAISLMGYNEGILLDEKHPIYPFKDGYTQFLSSWKQTYNPALWMENSCVWYSQVIARKLGIKKFQRYVNDLNYGNKNLSGDKGRNNGLDNAWLSSSLKISPIEQIRFLEKLVLGKLPVNKEAHKYTRNILKIETLPNGWNIYGKTGAGIKYDQSALIAKEIKIGWFVGWAEKGKQKIFFVRYIEDNKKSNIFASKRAKAMVRKFFLQF